MKKIGKKYVYHFKKRQQQQKKLNKQSKSVSRSWIKKKYIRNFIIKN